MTTRPAQSPASRRIAAQIKRERTLAKVSAEELARVARQHGLPWQKSTVMWIENGRRSITLDEFLLLPLVLQSALGRRFDVLDLLGATPGALKFNDVTWATPEGLRQLFEGEEMEVGPEPGLSPWGVRPPPEDPTKHEFFAQVAKRLRRHPNDVLAAAVRLWGHSVSDERQRRIDETISPEMTSESRAIAIGHITRKMTKELRSALEDDAPAETHCPECEAELDAKHATWCLAVPTSERKPAKRTRKSATTKGV